jgi:FixJ family two-component response regulator
MKPHSNIVTDTPVVHVVEDDESSGQATARVMRAAGLAVRIYQSASRFMEQSPTGPGCIILDLNLPGPSGLELQERLTQIEDALPIVFLTGHGNVPKTAHAMKAGAVDFLTKPVEAPVLLEAVSRALAQDAANRVVRDRWRKARARYERLTPREREVLSHVISGQLNKQIAFDLGTSEHTIKVHRHNVMAKLEAASVPDLVRLAEDLGIAPTGGPR